MRKPELPYDLIAVGAPAVALAAQERPDAKREARQATSGGSGGREKKSLDFVVNAMYK